MSKVDKLSTIDIGNLKIFNSLIIYEKGRDLKSLLDNPLIRKLDYPIKNRVISSMLFPKPEALTLFKEVSESMIIDNVTKYVINLYKKILEEYQSSRLLLVAILRSGLFLAFLLRYLFYKINSIEIEVISLSPNYLSQIDYNFFKNYINKSNKDILFVDGWSSRGVTYQIVERFWLNMFPQKKFVFAVLTDLSDIQASDFLSVSRDDFLIPWSMCQTDNTGLSNYFLHPDNKSGCVFYIPRHRRRIVNLEKIFRNSFECQVKTHIHLESKIKEQIKETNISSESNNQRNRYIKYGINECMKSIEKGDEIELYISDKINFYQREILWKYAKIYNINPNHTPKKFCFMIKKISQ